MVRWLLHMLTRLLNFLSALTCKTKFHFNFKNWIHTHRQRCDQDETGLCGRILYFASNPNLFLKSVDNISKILPKEGRGKHTRLITSRCHYLIIIAGFRTRVLLQWENGLLKPDDCCRNHNWAYRGTFFLITTGILFSAHTIISKEKDTRLWLSPFKPVFSQFTFDAAWKKASFKKPQAETYDWLVNPDQTCPAAITNSAVIFQSLVFLKSGA